MSSIEYHNGYPRLTPTPSGAGGVALNEIATQAGDDVAALEAADATLTAAVALKAPLASPTFTGSVTAPTFIGSLTGNASTATTAGTISGSITESQVTGLVADLAAKAPTASPTFTGTVTLPNTAM